MGPFFAALRKDSLKCGAYFSLLDWSQKDYPRLGEKTARRYKVEDDYPRWNRYRKFFQGQIGELMERFHPDLLWFDGDWEQSAERWESQHVRSLILEQNPRVLINGRLQGYGDYETPEQNIPVSRPAFPWWELCYTSNNNWGYHPDDTAFKTPEEIISVFADVIYNGGNLLLDIGPKADGTIPKPEVHLLTDLGKWVRKNSEAIYGTLGGIPQGHFFGPSTLSKDSTTLYLFLPARTSAKKRARQRAGGILFGTSACWVPMFTCTRKSSGKEFNKERRSGPHIHRRPKKRKAMDHYMTVLAVTLDGPLHLYRGHGGL